MWWVELLNSIVALLQSGAGGGGGGAYESIATVSGAGTTSVTFSSIPSTYQHLQLRWIARTSGATDVAFSLNVRFNGDTGANYVRHIMYGDGSTVNALAGTGESSIQIRASARRDGSTANVMGAAILDLHNYATTTQNKTVRSFSGADDNDATGEVALCSGLWLNTSAVNSITIFSGDNILSSSVFSLYGIKGA